MITKLVRISLITTGTGISLWLLILGVNLLTTANPDIDNQYKHNPINLSRTKPKSPPPKPPGTTIPKLAPRTTKQPQRAAQAPSSAQSAPIPRLPNLDWSLPGGEKIDLPLPAWQGPSPQGEPGAGKPPPPTYESAPLKGFKWLFAPELHDRQAMTRIYPKLARKRGLGGIVKIRVTLNSKGRVTDTVICMAHPPGIFERAALTMIKQWRGSRAGTFIQPIRFVHPDLWR